jgi:DNA-binding SARP family transcriptional activator
MTENKIGFGVLGPLQMTVDGAPVPLGTPKQRAVLAVLVMNRNRPVGTDSLITAAWEQWPPSEARASLHSYISNLRKLLGDSRSMLVNAPPGYSLTVGDSACDIGRFVLEKTAGVQAAAAGRFEQASDHLTTALAEWRGPVLEDLRDFQFVEAFATALTEDKVVAHTARAEAEIACGRGYAVIGELESLTVEHPYREPLWAQLIIAYYLADRQSEALDAYQRLKTTLADDLGIDPGPTVRALHERILRQEPRTGRLSDNDIVLDNPNVSRHHAVIIDTGTSFVITDLRSANGVDVANERIRGTATLADGDRIRICDHEFTFEIAPRET